MDFQGQQVLLKKIKLRFSHISIIFCKGWVNNQLPQEGNVTLHEDLCGDKSLQAFRFYKVIFSEPQPFLLCRLMYGRFSKPIRMVLHSISTANKILT